MDARRESEPVSAKNRTTVERKSDREVVVTRTINGPARIVFEGKAYNIQHIAEIGRREGLDIFAKLP